MVIEEYYGPLRRQMLRDIAADVKTLSASVGRDHLSARVMEVMTKVQRHHFVPIEVQAFAYANTPLPIGHGKTISQPFIVALMTDLLDLAPTDRVLEIGTGFGYQAAVLAELAGAVYTVEIIEALQVRAKKTLGQLGYKNIEFRLGNGSYGWPEKGPFDKIILTAAPELIPPPLLEQLKPAGRLVLPAGPPENQLLMLVERDAASRLTSRTILPVRFSRLEEEGPMKGHA
ncbi:MAG: protein-L-isoaspartate(D-aspartate) O-methyltransferase [Betaproteobacteria bacterium]|nr:protein-L-isoaspartate(D-aspartate) O-methyltransferase [Betaproteobacteria bacterium]